MRDHRHLVQRRLTIKDDQIIVHHVSFDDVTALQMKIRRFRMKTKINSITRVPNDGFAGIATNQFL